MLIVDMQKPFDAHLPQQGTAESRKQGLAWIVVIGIVWFQGNRRYMAMGDFPVITDEVDG